MTDGQYFSIGTSAARNGVLEVVYDVKEEEEKALFLLPPIWTDSDLLFRGNSFFFFLQFFF
jgi:hypothetical protein